MQFHDQADAEVLVSAEDAGRLEQMAKVFTSTIQKEYHRQ